MRKAGIILAATMLFGSAPALAAENLDCIANGMTDVQRESISVSHQAGRQIDEAIFDVIRACATRHDWSEEAQRHAVMHTFGANMRQSMLRAAPVSPAQLRAAEIAFDSVFTPAESRDMLANNMSEAASRRLAQAFRSAGLPADPAIQEWLGGFLAASQMEKLSRIDFAVA